MQILPHADLASAHKGRCMGGLLWFTWAECHVYFKKGSRDLHGTFYDSCMTLDLNCDTVSTYKIDNLWLPENAISSILFVRMTGWLDNNQGHQWTWYCPMLPAVNWFHWPQRWRTGIWNEQFWKYFDFRDGQGVMQHGQVCSAPSIELKCYTKGWKLGSKLYSEKNFDGGVRLRFLIGYPWLRKFWSKTYPWLRTISWFWAHSHVILGNFSSNIPLVREI